MSSEHPVGGVIAWLVAASFVWAVVAKLSSLSDFKAFTAAIAPRWLRPAMIVVPPLILGVEALAAVLLLTEPRTGAGVALGLLVAFSLVAEGVRLSGVRIRCACFGSGGRLLGRETTIRNLGIAGALVPVLLSPPDGSTLHDFRVAAAAATLLVAFRTLVTGATMARAINRGLPSS